MTGTLSAVIIGCLLILAFTALARPLAAMLRFLLSAAIGGGCLWVCNLLGLAVGVNPITLATAGVLGLPGVFGLVALSILL